LQAIGVTNYTSVLIHNISAKFVFSVQYCLTDQKIFGLTF